MPLPLSIFSKATNIGVFNPSDALNDRRKNLIYSETDRLRALGFRIIFGESINLTDVTFDEVSIGVRISDIQRFLSDPNIGMLMAAWGGKAANQLLEQFPYDLAQIQRKPMIGFSDTTVLLNAIAAQSNIPTFLGPNVVGKLSESEFGDLRQFQRGFIWKEFSPFRSSENSRVEVINDGNATGKLFGGNLKCFCLGLLLSGFSVKPFSGGIFLIEDTSSSVLEIEQILVSLLASGFFSNCGGILFSPSSDDARPSEVQKNMTIKNVLSRVFKDLSIPVVLVDSFGHGKRSNPALPIGAKVRISTQEKIIQVVDDIFQS